MKGGASAAVRQEVPLSTLARPWHDSPMSRRIRRPLAQPSHGARSSAPSVGSGTGPSGRPLVRWLSGVTPSEALSERRWGDGPSELPLAVERRESGLVVEVWRSAAELLGREVDVELTYEFEALIGLQIVGLSDRELLDLGFSAETAEDGLGVRSLDETLWMADLYDRLLRAEPDPEQTDAGLV